MSRGCNLCVVHTDEAGREHHQPDCPEMFWACSCLTPHRRAAHAPPLSESYRRTHPDSWQLGDEMRAIFSTVSVAIANSEEADVPNP